MSTRYNTGNPIESTDVRDMSDNAKNLDLFSNSSELSFDDRFGVERKTIQGMIAEFDAQILNMGFSRIGTFTAGATLTNPRQTLLWDTANGGDGQEYGWSGAFPKVVPPSSTPASTGGISVGAWMSRFDPELRIMVRESLRRSYAEAGYNLVAGSFGSGGNLHSATDVLLDAASGKAYSGVGPFPQNVAAGANPSAAGFIDRSGSVYGLTTVAEIATGGFSVGALLTVSDRNYELFKVVSGGTANNIDILPAGSGRTAVIADLSGIKSARAFGAKLDWNGVTGTDETAVFQRIHELGVNYSMDGKFSKITATLPMKDNQKVYFFGGGFYKPNSGYIISTNNVAVDNFIGYNGYFTGNLKADLIDISGAGAGYPNSAKNCKLIDCNAAQMRVLFNWDNARACQIVRGRYAGHTALQYTNKSAECLIESALLIKDEGFPTAGTKGVWAFAGAGGYPEGLTVKDSLIFRFEHNYAIDDLFIGKLHGNYIDSGDDCLQSYVRYGTKTEGVDIVNNWFFQRGLIIGKPGEVAPRQFRMLVDGNHFNAMKPGVDIEIEKWSHGVNLGLNHHNSDQTGIHVCVVALGNNNGIVIQGLNPIGYTQYVQMKGAGEHNTIANIPNVDGLAAPLSLEYPVNVYNVEGYYSLSEGGLSASPYVAGAVVASADNILLSAGVAHLSFDLSKVSIAGDGFLRVVAYKTGTFDQDDAVTIASVSGFAAYSSGDTSIRFSFPVAVKKATKTTFAVIVHTGSATITGGVIGSDGLVVMQ